MMNLDLMFKTDKKEFEAEFLEIQEGRAVLLDIREKSEWDSGRFKCARHFPLSQISQNPAGVEDSLKQMNEISDTIYLHCRSGARARMVEPYLRQYGFDSIKIIPASMMTMVENGFVLEK